MYNVSNKRYVCIRGKNDFDEVSENLANLKIISLDHQNYYVRNSSIISNSAKNVDVNV